MQGSFLLSNLYRGIILTNLTHCGKIPSFIDWLNITLIFRQIILLIPLNTTIGAESSLVGSFFNWFIILQTTFSVDNVYRQRFIAYKDTSDSFSKNWVENILIRGMLLHIVTQFVTNCYTIQRLYTHRDQCIVYHKPVMILF